MENKPRRASSPAVVVARLATAVVKPYNRKLGDWQISSIRLHALLARAVDTRSLSDLQAQRQAMIDDVAAEQQRFEAEVNELPHGAARHTKIEDTRRSLRMVIARLSQVMA